MTAHSTTYTYAPLITYSDVRCKGCARLLFRWNPRGLSLIEVKCPRCSLLNTVQLST